MQLESAIYKGIHKRKNIRKYQGAPRRKQFRFFFLGVPKITKINYFCTFSLVRSRQIKIKTLVLGP